MTIAKLLKSEPSREIVRAEGWIRTKRDSKNVCFFEVNDGSCLKGLQVVVDKATFPDMDTINAINTGAAVSFEGAIVKSEGGSQSVEMAATGVTLYGNADAQEYPLQKKRHTLEFLRDIGHLRARTNTIGAVMRVRSVMAGAVHEFFQQRGFYYVNTPLITTSDCEGAGEMFQVTTLNLDKLPKGKDGAVDYTKDFFGKRAALTVSGQLEGETYATALKNIYTFGPTFRAENSNTPRHLAEFWMIEPEMAFCDLEGDMDIAEDFLKYIFRAALERCPEDMDFFTKFIEPGVKEGLEKVVESPFARITYTDAIKELEKHNSDFEYPVHWGSDIQTEHERFIAEVMCKAPTCVTDYPKEIKAFYMKQNDDGKTVRAVDVLAPRLGEIIGGSERESDYGKLVSRIRELGMNPEDYWWYLDLRKYGSVPHSGFGLGFERAVRYVTGMQNIRDVIPYPRTPGCADF